MLIICKQLSTFIYAIENVSSQSFWIVRANVLM